MARDIREFVLACSVCARGKTSNRPPEGLLQPLLVPSRPWSHIALDFVTALPPSLGNTVVLTVVDRFSKAAHFIPLPKLPSAKETAATVVNHVFRIHGLPADVVSDRGPQFVSKFWREFCRLLGATVSLSSGFHPQTNGQTERANQDLERVTHLFSQAYKLCMNLVLQLYRITCTSSLFYSCYAYCVSICFSVSTMGLTYRGN